MERNNIKIQNIFTSIVKHAEVTHIFLFFFRFFLSGKFKNTVMSFKIGFVQRHWVAFQVTGAMRWHDVTLVRPGIKGSTLMMRSFTFAVLNHGGKVSMPAH